MAQTLRLTGARVALSATRTEQIDLTIQGSRILPFDTPPTTSALELDLSGHLILPGLINAHDHLEFNLFPRLGRGPYPNASAWAADIYHPDTSPVKEHLLVPKRDRLFWGGIKNLLSGVTTVAHHNPYDARVFTSDFPVSVVSRFGWAHSLAFSPDIRDAFDHTPARWPFIIHAAEGKDRCAQSEIAALDAMGILAKNTVLVHAVGATPQDLNTLRQRGASIVWCPTANEFTLGASLPPEALASGIPIALGTDSAMTGEGDLLDEMRHANTSAAVYPLVTTNAARILRLTSGQGTIRPRGAADLLAVVDQGQTPSQALLDSNPALVIVNGRVNLASAHLAAQFPNLHPIHLEGRGRYWIRADVPRLYATAASALGPEVRLAGRRVCP